MLSIELTLDDATDASVRAEWRALEDAGIPSLVRNTSPSNRPHVTLFVAPAMRVEDLTAVRDAVSSLPLPLTLGATLLFGGHRRGYVLARQVVVTSALLELHRRVHESATPLAESVVDLSRPDAWTPHVTLARRLRPDDVGPALAAVGAAALPTGSAPTARLWDGVAKTITPLS